MFVSALGSGYVGIRAEVALPSTKGSVAGVASIGWLSFAVMVMSPSSVSVVLKLISASAIGVSIDGLRRHL